MPQFGDPAIARALQAMFVNRQGQGGGNPNYTLGHGGTPDQDLAPGQQPEMGAADIMGLPAAMNFAQPGIPYPNFPNSAAAQSANPNYTRNFGQTMGDFGDMSPVVAGLGPNMANPLDRGGSPYGSSNAAAVDRLIAAMIAARADRGEANPNYMRGHGGMIDQDLAPGQQPEMGAADRMGLPAALAFSQSQTYEPQNFNGQPLRYGLRVGGFGPTAGSKTVPDFRKFGPY